MCGRFTHMMPWSEVVRLCRLATAPEQPLLPNFNVAPTQNVPIIRNSTSGREAAIVRWGLIPFWANDPAIGSSMINARCETVATKPAFRPAFKQRRCLIPADGFYEWLKPAIRGGKKQPYYFRLKNAQPFLFAGLWERWDKGDEPIESCTIITCDANELVSPFHNRMPVILASEAIDEWLEGQDPAALQSALVPAPANQMETFPVSTRVNSPRNNDRTCIEPITAPGEEAPPPSDR